MTQYKASTGLTAVVDQDLLVVTWAGQGGSDVRARYVVEKGQPVIRDLAVRKQGGQWAVLGQNLAPEYHVVSGMRRMSSDQVASLPARRHRADARSDQAKNRCWFVRFMTRRSRFPGKSGRANAALAPEARGDSPRRLGLQRHWLQREDADGARTGSKLPGALDGDLLGQSLQFTVYRGTNLIRMDALATTHGTNSWPTTYDAGT